MNEDDEATGGIVPNENTKKEPTFEVRFFYMPMIDGLCKIQKELSKRK
jgi:hypothetical protein